MTTSLKRTAAQCPQTRLRRSLPSSRRRGAAALVGALALAAAPAVAARELGEATFENDAEPAAEGMLAPPHSDVILGAQYFLVEGKSMPGLTLQLGTGLFAAELETTLLWATEPPAESDTSFLGMAMGASLMLVPIRTEQLRVLGGVGGDLYYPWRIHEDQTYLALSAKVALQAWLTREVGLFGTARVYPLHDGGLEMGVSRDGSEGLPVLISAGVAWRFR